MNWVALLILIAFLADFLLHVLADLLNLKHLKFDIPHPFQGLYDEARYRQAQAYLRENTRFDWLASSIHLVALLLFWFGGGFSTLDAWVRSLQLGPVTSGMLYIGALAALRGLIAIPFSLYSTFVIEERYGFNRTTLKTYIGDLFKGVLLGIVLGAPLLASILAFFNYLGPSAWWYCWLAVTIYILGVQFIAPTWILPLFNKFTLLKQGELREAIVSYAKSIGFPLENIFVMDGSRRSSKSNAFFTGFGRHRRIVLFDTLVDRHSVPELVAVLAHEMGHYRKKHILKNMIIGILHTGLVLYLLSLFISAQALFDAFFLNRPSVYAGLVFFAMLYAPLEFFISLAMQMISRRHEYEADRFVAQTTGDPNALIDALKKLSVNNLSNLKPHPFYVFLNYSHPPVLGRIRALQREIV
jgi:STE24 endopeptidase